MNTSEPTPEHPARYDGFAVHVPAPQPTPSDCGQGGQSAPRGNETAIREFPQLAAVVDKHTPSGAEGHVQCWCGEQFHAFREHADHVADAWREACTIRTVEELDALPQFAVVRDRVGTIWENCWASRIVLPALLIWHPDWERP